MKRTAGKKIQVPAVRFFVFLLIPLLLTSCDKPMATGSLLVNAQRDGTYEIYRYATSDRKQFVAETVGHFNIPSELLPGSYLILSDCSSESITIYAGSKNTMTAHTVDFVPPSVPGRNDSFSIQCDQSEETRARQSFTNQYSLNLLHGKRDLLVGMVPFTIDFDKLSNGQEPKVLSYNLGAVKVAQFGDGLQPVSFFVSPTKSLISITKPQVFGTWEYLLPGEYLLEVNGTHINVNVTEGTEETIIPAFIRVEVSDGVDLTQAAKIKGSPQLVEINNGHWLNFNETYPVLPGAASLKISGSSRELNVELTSNETLTVKANSVTVDLSCSPWEWSCLGDKDVSLYLGDSPYPFVESVSDIPNIYLADEEHEISIGIEGSRDIRYRLKKKRDQSLQLGFVKLIPKPAFRQGQITDLVRVESIREPQIGNSLDLVLDKPTVMPLIAGQYRIAQYLSLSATEGERKMIPRNVWIKRGQTIEIEFPVYLSDKNYQKHLASEAKDTASSDRKLSKNARSRRNKFRPVRLY